MNIEEKLQGVENAIGKRIVDKLKQRKGTMRWIGSLPINNDTDEPWVGIEWDKSEDGTHRGEHKGVQYFECKSSSSTASFLKLSKVDFGISFLRAVSLKYDDENLQNDEAAYVFTQEGRKVQIEFVGKEKAKKIASQISDKQIISLSNFNLSHSYAKQEEPLVFHSTFFLFSFSVSQFSKMINRT
jgi:tubulin-specific chaperone E